MAAHFWLLMIAGMLLSLLITVSVRAALARLARSALTAPSPKPAVAPRSWWARVTDLVRGSPYGHRYRGRLRVRDPDGKLVPDLQAEPALVSRHGLRGSGVVCPLCHKLAAATGEWGKVTMTPIGEVVCCFPCRTILLASPDDDIDPVRPGQKYDESVYHTFARPAGSIRPRQRTLSRDPVPGDWGVVEGFIWTRPDGSTQDLDRGEGRVIAAGDGAVTLALVEGLGGAGITAVIPIARVRPMAWETLTKGDKVRLVRGIYEGRVAVVESAKEAIITLDVEGDHQSVSVPIEHLQKIHE